MPPHPILHRNLGPLQNINKLFINIVEQMLMDKPDNPVVYICSYLKKEYPEAFSVVEGDKAKVQETIDPLSDDEDDEDDDDVVDELPPMKARPAGRHGGAGRRVSVSAGVFDHRSLMASQFKAPINKKSDDAADGIRKILQNSLLFGHLDSTQMQTVVDAMFSKKFSNGDCIIEQGDTNADAYFVLNEGSAEVLKDGEKIVEYEAGSHAARFGYSMFFVCAIAPPFSLTLFPFPCFQGFGELALMYNAPRAATVRATSDVTVWALDRDTFKQIIVATTIAKRENHKMFLSKCPLLQSLDDNERSTIADALQEVPQKAGDMIITQGEPGHDFYIIKSGKVVCIKDGKEVLQLDTGCYFGEIALITNQNRQASVKALEDTILLKLGRKTFQRVMGPLTEILKRNLSHYSQVMSAHAV